MRLFKLFLCTVAVLAFSATAGFAQTGKISGTVSDAETGQPLPGVNVIIAGTQQGSTTNANGQYTIINVEPGTYTVRASFIGYTPQNIEGVEVNIDLTSTADFELPTATVGLDEVTVQATEPVVRKDISGNVANLSAEEIENAPVSSVEDVVGLQAGVEGLSVRGSDLSEVSLNVDGASMRNARDNTPFTGISYTSIDQVQVQTGGFNAEYGNVRSGLINVVTKDGPRDHYTVDVLTKYTPPTKKYQGPYPNDAGSYWMRPFVDDEVAFEGDGAWDRYTDRQYPDFEGWNKISQELADDGDTSNDLTPQQLQDIFKYRTRKNFEPQHPDYTVDASFGGPVPVVSDALGDLRFFASFRQNQSAYLVPISRDVYKDQVGRLKLTSNVAKGMKLVLHGMHGKQSGVSGNAQGFPHMFTGGSGLAYWFSWDNPVFGKGMWVPKDVTRNMIGGNLTHTLNASTFYEVSFQSMSTKYDQTPDGFRRDNSVAKRFEIKDSTGAPTGEFYEIDEAPFGCEPTGGNDFSGMRIGGHWCSGRDTSEVSSYTGSFDITSQLTQYSQMKAGVEYIYQNMDMKHGEVDSFFANLSNPKYNWHRQPRQGAAYVQNKLEFDGMVTNIGLRVDYFNPGGEWYNYGSYAREFSSKYDPTQLDTLLTTKSAGAQISVSPRLGVSFPITASSKLFFNYGHFRQLLNPNDIFAVEVVSPGRVGRIGNPNHPLPKTVAYELGYEHNLFNQFLLRVTGYYKALGNQPRNVRYTSIDGQVNYSVPKPLNYEDIRGFEVVLRKNSGWVRGFANYTYMVTKAGNFGYGQYNENRVQQRNYVRSVMNSLYIPDPRPFARANLEFLAPKDFGPELAGVHPLGDWRVSFLGSWKEGDAFNWHGPNNTIEGLENNVSWKDRWDLDARLSKNVNSGLGEIQFFADINNVLNLKNCCGAGFQGPNDYTHYMQSLHLSEDAFGDFDAPYNYIPGSDKPGDYRPAGVEFTPIEVVNGLPDTGHERPLYFEEESNGYHVWDGSSWQKADQKRVDNVLENKAYIDNPNNRSFTFLDPRRVNLGLRLTF